MERLLIHDLIDKARIWARERKLKRETYNVPMPDTEEELRKIVNTQHGQVMGENVNLKSELEHLKEVQKNARDKQKKIEKELGEFQRIEKAIKNQSRIIFKLDGVGYELESPKILTKSNKLLGVLYGFEMYETEDGTPYWFMLYDTLNPKTGRLERRRFRRPASDFFSIFKNKLSPVSQIHSGALATNFDISKGKPILKDDIFLTETDGEKVRIIDMSEDKINEYENVIAKFKDMLGQVHRENKELKDLTSDYESKLKKVEIDKSVAEASAKSSDAAAASIGERLKTHAATTADSLGVITDSQMTQLLAQKQNLKLIDVIDKNRKEIDSLLSKGAIQEAQTRLLELQTTVVEHLSQMHKAMPEKVVVKPSKKVEKPPEKSPGAAA